MGARANDAPRKQLDFVGHEALLTMAKLADWVNRHRETATTHEVYAGFAISKYGNLTGKTLTDQSQLAYKVVV
jgi:hypothetical protein